MDCEIISIGDELLIGQVTNTNASWMASEFSASGIVVRRITTVPDDTEDIINAIQSALEKNKLVVLSGGLGPTKDDMTKEALCIYFNVSLFLHQPTLDHIERLFGGRGIPVLQKNRDQALIPENAIPLTNIHGTAPGLWFEQDGKIIVSLPGVPYELKALVTESVIPRLVESQQLATFFHRTILTQGMGESLLSERISRWEDNLPVNIKLAYLPQPGLVRLRISAHGTDRNLVIQEIDEQVSRLEELIPELVFGYDNDTLESVVGEMLVKSGRTLATAESCTGGYLAHLITSVPGSSRYYKGSIISYDNSIKEGLLGVNKDSLVKYGAVSDVVVKQMAESARKKFNSDYALATSGIAGPGGGTPDKPVGLVFVALAGPGETVISKYTFGEHRGRNIRRSSLAALNMLRLELYRLLSLGDKGING
jgi:nicotinamide-nucleotide amidase